MSSLIYIASPFLFCYTYFYKLPVQTAHLSGGVSSSIVLVQ